VDGVTKRLKKGRAALQYRPEYIYSIDPWPEWIPLSRPAKMWDEYVSKGPTKRVKRQYRAAMKKLKPLSLAELVRGLQSAGADRIQKFIG
jgi:hypothetical protein